MYLSENIQGILLTSSNMFQPFDKDGPKQMQNDNKKSIIKNISRVNQDYDGTINMCNSSKN